MQSPSKGSLVSAVALCSFSGADGRFRRGQRFTTTEKRMCELESRSLARRIYMTKAVEAPAPAEDVAEKSTKTDEVPAENETPIEAPADEDNSEEETPADEPASEDETPPTPSKKAPSKKGKSGRK